MSGSEIDTSRLVDFSDTALVLQPDITYEAWATIGDRLQRSAGSINWWLGDWLNYGEKRFGEAYAQGVLETAYAYQTLANMKWVAGAIPPSLRRETLSWKHHAEVAKFSGDEDLIEGWLNEAEDRKLSASGLRRAIKEAAAPTPLETEAERVAAIRGFQDATPEEKIAAAVQAFRDSTPGLLRIAGLTEPQIEEVITEVEEAIRPGGGFVIQKEKVIEAAFCAAEPEPIEAAFSVREEPEEERVIYLVEHHHRYEEQPSIHSAWETPEDAIRVRDEERATWAVSDRYDRPSEVEVSVLILNSEDPNRWDRARKIEEGLDRTLAL